VIRTTIDLALLSRYYSGDISSEERKQVEEWMTLSDENKSLAKEAYRLFYASDTLNVMKKIDAGSVLKKINRRLKQKNKRMTAVNLLHRITIISFVPLLIGTILYLKSPAEEQQTRYMEARAGYGLISSLELPDGSKVWLNSGSYIKYPSTFAKNKREVYVTGEAYFSVVKDADRKFVVQTHEHLSLEVLGTEFNIDAYETNDFIKTTLVEGSVHINYTNEKGEAKRFLMKPEQQITYIPQTHKINLQNAYVQKDIAWKNGHVIFRNTPFDEALWILNKRFNVNFIVKKEALHDYSFTGSFTDQDLIRILEHFKLSSGINYSQKQMISENGEIQKTEINLY
jgi:ferric-dicitrate binding protein FerR (iron transport regulator)